MLVLSLISIFWGDEQQYQYFPAWGYVLVGWLSGTREPVLGHKDVLVGVAVAVIPAPIAYIMSSNMMHQKKKKRKSAITDFLNQLSHL